MARRYAGRGDDPFEKRPPAQARAGTNLTVLSDGKPVTVRLDKGETLFETVAGSRYVLRPLELAVAAQ